MIWRRLAICLVGCTGWSRDAHAGVIRVDPSGAGDFTAIQPAIDAAANGDVILVAAGDYWTPAVGQLAANLIVDAKALTLIADPPGASVKVPGMRILNLAANQTVFVRGFDALPSPD
jgi:hypothetical protein